MMILLQGMCILHILYDFDILHCRFFSDIQNIKQEANMSISNSIKTADFKAEKHVPVIKVVSRDGDTDIAVAYSMENARSSKFAFK